MQSKTNRLLLHICYLFLFLVISWVVSRFVGMVAGWIVSPKDLADAKGDLRYNYYVAYPVRGLLMLGSFLLSLYLCCRSFGYRDAFRYREAMTRNRFLIEAIPALVLYTLFVYWFSWFSMSSWYLSGSLAALFGVIDASDIYRSFEGSTLEGLVTVQDISMRFYLWLQILLDILLTIPYALLMYKSRKSGERSAAKAHEKQLAEMKAEHGLQ